MHEDDDSITTSAHSLAHAWAKERQGYQSRCRAWRSAATISRLSCERRCECCPFFVFLQSHVRACVDHEIEDYTQNMSDTEAAQILFQFAYGLDAMFKEGLLVFSFSAYFQGCKTDIEPIRKSHCKSGLSLGKYLCNKGNTERLWNWLSMLSRFEESWPKIITLGSRYGTIAKRYLDCGFNMGEYDLRDSNLRHSSKT